jgi:hypothetical protein
VIEALHQRRISIAAARELNKCSDANRMLILLDTAQNQGATARQIAEWRRDADALGVIPIPYVDPADAAAAAATATGPHAMQCVFCHSPEYVWMMDMVYLHKPCADMLRKLLGS